ncbi:ccar1 [Anaeramoeba flamelloides]|uniref:Ccar1 n=1 Tax=Anaeramoeba flamelloides TaxID=1746091 RepID=A0AAV8A068_9EUKA|nr:ccar1 [Anaeramoeba flamelloides]
MTDNNEEEAELVNIDLQPTPNVNYFAFNNAIVSPNGVFSPSFSTSPYYYFPTANDSTLFQITTPTYYPFPNFNNTPTKTPTNIPLQNPLISPIKIPTHSPIKIPTYFKQTPTQALTKTVPSATPIVPTPTRPLQDLKTFEHPKQSLIQASQQNKKGNLKNEIKQKLLELSQMKNKYDQYLTSQLLKSVKKKRNRRLNKKLTSINKANSFHQMPQRKRQQQKQFNQKFPKKKRPLKQIKFKNNQILKNQKSVPIQKKKRQNQNYGNLNQKRIKKNLKTKIGKKNSFKNQEIGFRKRNYALNRFHSDKKETKRDQVLRQKNQKKEKENQDTCDEINEYIEEEEREEEEEVEAEAEVEEEEEEEDKEIDNNTLIENSRDLFKLFIGVIWVISGGSTINRLGYYSDTIIFQISKSLNLKQEMILPIKDQLKYLLTNSRRTFTEYILEIFIGIFSLNHSENKQKIPEISNRSWNLLSRLDLLQQSNGKGNKQKKGKEKGSEKGKEKGKRTEKENDITQEKNNIQENLEELYSQIFSKKILIYWFSKRYIGRLKPLFSGDVIENFFTNHLNAFGKSKFMLTCLVLSKNLQIIKKSSEKYFNLINLNYDSDPLNLYANNRTKKHKIIRDLIVKFSLNDGEYWSILSQDYFNKMKFDHLNMFNNFPFNSIINDPKLNQYCGGSQPETNTQTKRILACKGKKINSLINVDWILKK